MNKNELNHLIEHYSRKIIENKTNYYLIDNFKQLIYGTDANIHGNQITLLKAKIINKNETLPAKFKTKVQFKISSINSFNCCPKSNYSEIDIETIEHYNEF